ncbi:MAG: DEAD/DEAH box helicase [Saprospiraceae bacterium]
MNFRELHLNELLLEGLDAMGFEKATPIQEKAIPAIIKGQDIIACAQTGTGKTAAFLLPVLDRLITKPATGIDTLILVPTRELATQIDQQLDGFAYFLDITSLPIYGGRDGASFEQEKKALSMGASIIVATPGRLIAHLNMGYVKMDKLRHLILDEADRMLDMGFINDIQKIIDFLPKNRQTLMFSATMPSKIRQFAKRILNNPVQFTLSVSKPAEGILQVAYEAQDDQKPALIKSLLAKRKGKNERILIFSKTKASVKNVVGILRSAGLEVGEIHSDFEQNERELTLRAFKNGTVNILVATDILSRGIDASDIRLVINYDVPGDAEDYIHRIGRTARANSDGLALTFINKQDRRKFRNIEELMEKEVRKLPLPDDVPPSKESTNRPQNARPGRNGRSANGRSSSGPKSRNPSRNSNPKRSKRPN